MDTNRFVVLLASRLAAAGVKDAEMQAGQFVRDNPGIENEMTPEAAAKDWLETAEDPADWRDPASYRY